MSATIWSSNLPVGFEIAAAAMRALLGMNVVLDEDGPRRRLGPKDAGMLAMLLCGGDRAGVPCRGGRLCLVRLPRCRKV